MLPREPTEVGVSGTAFAIIERPAETMPSRLLGHLLYVRHNVRNRVARKCWGNIQQQ